ncbi:hypothetical protein HBI23_256600 [Parastagonospora nodorum]|nr:hypothetical protein HBI23_256600 [Parastagonospora nodorum]
MTLRKRYAMDRVGAIAPSSSQIRGIHVPKGSNNPLHAADSRKPKMSRNIHTHLGKEKRHGFGHCGTRVHDTCEHPVFQHCCQHAKKRGWNHRAAEEIDSNSDSLSSGFSDTSEVGISREGTKAKRPRPSPNSGHDKSAAQSDDLAQPPCPEKSLSTQIEKLSDVLANFTTQQSDEKIQDTATDHSDRKPLEFKRLDRVYDGQLRNWRLVKSKKNCQQVSRCVFEVRREYDVDGKLEKTRVQINTEVLRAALEHIFRACGYTAVVEGIYDVDPHLLFHFRADISAHLQRMRECKGNKAFRARDKELLSSQGTQCTLLLDFIKEDFAGVEERLEAMLKRGVVSYDLIWALFEPGTIAYTATYQNEDDPRCFIVETVHEYDAWVIDGKYLDCDGKRFIKGRYRVAIQEFKGCKEITSLATYPLQYHRDSDAIRHELVERGRKFVSLLGINHRFHRGVAYMKNDNEVARWNCNSRIMVDPATFRRVNPNYPYANKWEHVDHEDRVRASIDRGPTDLAKTAGTHTCAPYEEHTRTQCHSSRKPLQRCSAIVSKVSCEVDSIAEPSERARFTEEELLVSSPVVLGFDLAEKCWLEFSVSGLHEIQWNENALHSPSSAHYYQPSGKQC